jgi:hypothetical protein
VSDPQVSVPRLRVVADLDVEVGDHQGSTTAHLTSGVGGLVLEVGDPAVLLRAVPGRGLSRDLPVQVPRKLLADLPVRLRSHGRDLGRVHLTAGGRLRFRPTPVGMLVAARTGLTYGRTPYVLGAALVVAVLSAWAARSRT